MNEKKHVWILLSKEGLEWLPVVTSGVYGNESNVWAFSSKEVGARWIDGTSGTWSQYKLRRMRVKP